MADVEIKMYLDHVRAVVEKATEATLKTLAFRIVERTQLNIRSNNQVDTGFMVNSVYAVWKDGSGYSQAKSLADSAPARSSKGYGPRGGREVIEETLPPDATVGVVVGANYAIYQEVKKPFAYPGAEAAAAEFGGYAEQVFREHLPDEGTGAV